MDAQTILKQKDFRITSHRCDVLSYLISSKVALTHSDFEKKFKEKIDRVSLYRILNAFTEKHIICKIIDSQGTVSYVFDNHSNCDQSVAHPHYKCKSCNDVVELPALPKAYLDQLKDLKIDAINVLAEGICNECQDKKLKE
jgi:Fur family transcriptional regulator, ferric uptake regulator